MKCRVPVLLVLSIVLLVPSIGVADELPPPDKSIVIQLSPGLKADDVVWKLRSKGTTGINGLDVILRDWTLKTVVPVFGRTGKPIKDPGLFESLGMDRFLMIGWAKGSAPQPAHVLDHITDQLRQLPQVEQSYWNGVGEGAYTPNDPGFPSQWHHATIISTMAWEFTRGSPDILVAVVDSGITSTNVDLDYSLISNGYDYVESDWDPEDEYGHGTHVTGIIAAEGDNNIDTVGLAWGCSILNIRVIDEFNSCTWADTAAGIEEAADSGARIINLSIQGCGGSSDLEEAVNYAHGLGSAVVACMGNWDSMWTSYPAGYSNTIAVGMTDSNDYRVGTACSPNTTCATWDFGSNVGPHIDVVAPGRYIISTHWGSTGTLSGTSMATPMVSAMAALVWEIRSDYDNEDIRDFIRATARDEVGEPCEDVAGFDDYMGYGRINFGPGVLVASASTNCSLTYSAAMLMSPAPLFEPFYWLRDAKFRPLPFGRRLVADYYKTSPKICGASEKDVWLTVDIVNAAFSALPLIEHVRQHPDIPVLIQRKQWDEACTLAETILASVDRETRQILRPWVVRARTEPIQLLSDLGIIARIIDQ
ncbi:MAG: S8 family serine peptidase [Verrucomicrobia bacterium]|nr:S8 family serine peptidase [Verrucomicrobiota bacterium]